MLANRRPSLSPSLDEKFRAFNRADDQVSVAADARERVISQLQGATQHTSHVGWEILFDNIANILPYEAEAVGDMKGLVGGRSIRPDYYYGIHPGRLANDLEIRNELSQYIMPSTESTRPMVPNFFIEAKGPKGLYVDVVNQACIDGAIDARGMHKLQTYGQRVPKYNNNTSAITCIYKDGTLKIYAHHPGQPNGRGTEPEYYMNQLRAFAMTDNCDTLRQGMTAFRNSVEWADEQRNAVIEQAKAVANSNINADDDDNDEEQDEDKTEDEAEERDDIKYYLTATAANAIISSSTSQSPFSTVQTTSRRSGTAHQDSDTSADELAQDRPASKRPA